MHASVCIMIIQNYCLVLSENLPNKPMKFRCHKKSTINIQLMYRTIKFEIYLIRKTDLLFMYF